ncbi:MAG TPA: hypothetical protein VLN57_15190, partial [Xanthobacteraceae bacterium]|nr:hypothetical protein [Xanthobacteraceae bacterium]
IVGFVESENLNKKADYLTKGRSYKHLSEQQLTDEWVRIAKSLANDPYDAETGLMQSHLTYEFELRGKEVPHELVEKYSDQFFSRVETVLRGLGKNERKRVQQELENDIAAFKAARDQSKN